jgi:DnaK suppressor protein
MNITALFGVLEAAMGRTYTPPSFFTLYEVWSSLMGVELPEGYRPGENEDYMNPRHLEYFRRKLLAWRDELLAESQETINHLQSENWQEPDIVDRASIEADASLELRTRNRYRKLIAKIDAALRRIDDGTYGYCEETGEEIGVRRLDARPIATLSIEAQERHERKERQQADDHG